MPTLMQSVMNASARSSASSATTSSVSAASQNWSALVNLPERTYAAHGRVLGPDFAINESAAALDDRQADLSRGRRRYPLGSVRRSPSLWISESTGSFLANPSATSLSAYSSTRASFPVQVVQCRLRISSCDRQILSSGSVRFGRTMKMSLSVRMAPAAADPNKAANGVAVLQDSISDRILCSSNSRKPAIVATAGAMRCSRFN